MGDLGGRNADAVDVAVEEHAFAFALSALGRLDELAGAGASPEGLEEASPAGVRLGAVVAAHDLLDGFAGLIGVVEGDGADIVVENVSFDDAVEYMAADEAKVAVNGCCGATGKVPYFGLVMREGWVGVLQISDGNCNC